MAEIYLEEKRDKSMFTVCYRFTFLGILKFFTLFISIFNIFRP